MSEGSRYLSSLFKVGERIVFPAADGTLLKKPPVSVAIITAINEGAGTITLKLGSGVVSDAPTTPNGANI